MANTSTISEDFLILVRSRVWDVISGVNFPHSELYSGDLIDMSIVLTYRLMNGDTVQSLIEWVNKEHEEQNRWKIQI